VYLAAFKALGVEPARAVALEDSPHGATAAKHAGMSCVAVPTELGRDLDFGHADAVVDTLAGVDMAALRSLIGPSGS
jgi:beta-phosphoglucomutase-like phosphatase (HAD superfamily)